jgi:hypothetical protein
MSLEGTFDQGDVEYCQELMASSCPNCISGLHGGPLLATVMYPTAGEMLALGDPDSVRQANEIMAIRARRKETEFRSEEQLPDIPAESFALADAEPQAVIRAGSQATHWRALRDSLPNRTTPTKVVA